VRIVARSAAALRLHNRHPDDIIPGGRRCPRTLLTPTAGGVAINLNLLGVAEQPDLGDPDATGTATIRMRLGQGRVCFVLNVQNIVLPAAGAHIHRGTTTEAGPIVVPFVAPSAGGSSRGCAVASRALVREILRNPSQFYVNVHTSEFPAGAVRAQLSLPTSTVVLRLNMTGAAERPNPGDPNGTGMAAFLVFPDTGRICFTLTARDIQLPTIGAHIHRGTVDVAGDIVVPLTAPPASGISSGCVTADPALVRDIAQNRANYYVNVHTREFPAGAIRSQLSAAS
jgi:hypothetical protein